MRVARGAGGAYHIIMSAFPSVTPVVVAVGFTGDHVGDVAQLPPQRLRPQPTVMRILNDAGFADDPDDEIEGHLGLRRHHDVVICAPPPVAT